MGNYRSLAEKYIREEQVDFFRNEVEDLLRVNNEKELEDRFYQKLSFGTGGLRGVIGGGDNRMNPLNIRKASAGLGNYVLKEGREGEKSIAVAYDSRNYSDLFAKEAALTFAALGIKVYLFTSLRPTPELSYTVRHLEASAGVVVTASHNPAEYNGYKVYWNDGAQVVEPHDNRIIEEVRSIEELPQISEEEAFSKGLLVMIDREADDSYLGMVKRESINPKLFAESGSVKIVYTPLHGAGLVSVERVLGELGLNVITVPQQRDPDGNFPTAPYPNPEIAEAMKLAMELGEKEGADLIMGTDPDADRLGIGIPTKEGYKLVTGNQLGVLLVDYICRMRREMGKLPDNSAFINTVVTTTLQNRVAESYGVDSFRVLTGFKFIAQQIREFEQSGSHTFIFGCEESYGYQVCDKVRDKDGVSAALLATEMALWNHSRGASIEEHLDEIYSKHGYYEDIQISQEFKGASGAESMAGLMERLRENPPSRWGGIDVVEKRDYLKRVTFNFETKTSGIIGLPPSNVLQFLLSDGTLVTARPSGTEPKIKFYISLSGGNSASEGKPICKEKRDAIKTEIDRMIESV